MTRFLRGERPPRPAVPRGHPLAALRQADPEWQPAWRRGPVDPAYDPCGAPPIRGGAITTLIATMRRYAR
jgi:hypothetical protein